MSCRIRRKPWQKLLSLAGIQFNHDWTAEEYKAFLLENGWRVTKSQIVSGRIDLLYAECAVLENENIREEEYDKKFTKTKISP